MEKFLMALIVTAIMMTRGAYNEFRGWTVPADENPDDEGYKVIDPNTGNVSWVPKEKFEKTSRKVDNLTFGYAVEAMKLGKKVSREGWNGKGMWLMLCIPDGGYTLESTGKTYARSPYIYMKTADDKLIPWVASQTDILAEDWGIIE